MPFFLRKKTDSEGLPAEITLGMHISGGENTKPVYFVLRSLIALAGLLGTLLCFITACSDDRFYHYPAGKTVIAALIGWACFSAVFSIYEKKPELSRNLASGGVILLMIYGIIRVKYIAAGFMNSANIFMSAFYNKYRLIPLFSVPDALEGPGGEIIGIDVCTDEALIFLALLLSPIVCRGTVKRPNILLMLGATFPLAELCLYFGLVPNYGAFALLLCSWAGALAAEITESGAFADDSARSLFTKTSAQSALAAALIMLLSFSGALIYSHDFTRPERADSFRTGFLHYMRDFSWQKLKEDMQDAFLPAKSKGVTHDGKLGNVESVEFSGQNMLEVTLPEDSGNMYLKGFTGTEYTGSRWNAGPAVPALETKLTSPEFFSGRTLKYIPEYNSLISRDVLVRNTGMASSVRYYPVNSAGMTAADGSLRTYGVYFPPDEDWRRTVIGYAGDIKLSESLGKDEAKLRLHAERSCLEVPETFTAAEEFFSDYDGTDLYDELTFIRTKLAEECEYSLDAGKKPFGADFAQWFLTDNHKGSCTHFASAAVLLCRSRGIPARYCEGFIVKSEDIESFTPENGYVTVSVPDTRAHAWAEVYINGYGWLSFEATPGYGNVSVGYSDESESEISSVITSVTTEAPVFSDSVTSETTVTFTATVTEDSTVTEETDIPADDTAVSEVTTAVPDESGPSTEGFGYQTSSDTESENAVTTVPDDASEISAGTETSIVSTGTGEDIPEERPTVDPAVIRALLTVLTVIGAAAAAVGLILLRRRLIFLLRRRRMNRYPDKSASDIYNMLMRSAGDMEVSTNVPADELAERLGDSGYFDTELCGIIISTALKARFGGGITVHEAENSAAAYERIASALNERSRSVKILSIVLYCSDKYI